MYQRCAVCSSVIDKGLWFSPTSGYYVHDSCQHGWYDKYLSVTPPTTAESTPRNYYQDQQMQSTPPQIIPQLPLQQLPQQQLLLQFSQQQLPQQHVPKQQRPQQQQQNPRQQYSVQQIPQQQLTPQQPLIVQQIPQQQFAQQFLLQQHITPQQIPQQQLIPQQQYSVQEIPPLQILQQQVPTQQQIPKLLPVQKLRTQQDPSPQDTGIIVTLRLNSNDAIPILRDQILSSEKTGWTLRRGDEIQVYPELNGFYKLSNGSGYVFKNYAGVEWAVVNTRKMAGPPLLKAAPPAAPIPAPTLAVARFAPPVDLQLCLFEDYLTLKLKSNNLVFIYKAPSQSAEQVSHWRPEVEREVFAEVNGFHQLLDGSGYVYRSGAAFEVHERQCLVTLKITMTSDITVPIFTEPKRAATKTGVTIMKGIEYYAFVNLCDGYYRLVDGSGYIYKYLNGVEWVETSVRQKVFSLNLKSNHVIHMLKESKLSSPKHLQLKKAEGYVVFADPITVGQAAIYKLIDSSGYIHRHPSVEWEEMSVLKTNSIKNFNIISPPFIFEDVITLQLNTDSVVPIFKEANNTTPIDTAVRRGDKYQVFSKMQSDYFQLIDGTGYLPSIYKWTESVRQDVVISKLILTSGAESIDVYKEPTFNSEKTTLALKQNQEKLVYANKNSSDGFRRLFDDSGYIYTLKSGTEWFESNSWKSVISVKINSNHAVAVMKEPKVGAEKNGKILRNGDEFLVFSELKSSYYVLINGTGFIYKSSSVTWIVNTVSDQHVYVNTRPNSIITSVSSASQPALTSTISASAPASAPTPASIVQAAPPKSNPLLPPTMTDQIVTLTLQSDHTIFIPTVASVKAGTDIRVQCDPRTGGYKILDGTGGYIFPVSSNVNTLVSQVAIAAVKPQPIITPPVVVQAQPAVVEALKSLSSPSLVPTVVAESPTRLLKRYLLIDDGVTLKLNSKHSIPIYEAANSASAKVGTMSKGDEFQISPTMESNFYRVCDGTGFVYSNYEHVEFVKSTKQYVATLKLTLDSDCAIPVFKERNRSSEKFGSLTRGESVHVYAVPEQGYYLILDASEYVFKLYEGVTWREEPVVAEVILLTLKSNHAVPIRREPKHDGVKTGVTMSKGHSCVVFAESVSGFYRLVDGTGFVQRHSSVEWTQGAVRQNEFYSPDDMVPKRAEICEVSKIIELKMDTVIPIYSASNLSSEKTPLSLKKGEAKRVYSNDENNFFKLADDSGYVYKAYKGVEWAQSDLRKEVITLSLRLESDTKVSVFYQPGLDKEKSNIVLSKDDELEVFTEPLSGFYKKINSSGYVSVASKGAVWVQTVIRKEVITLQLESAHVIPIHKTPNATSEKVGKMERNKEVIVYAEKVKSFYRLFNGSGYVFSAYKGVKMVVETVSGNREMEADCLPAAIFPANTTVVSLNKLPSAQKSKLSKPWLNSKLFIFVVNCSELVNHENYNQVTDTYLQLQWGDCEEITNKKHCKGGHTTFTLDKQMELSSTYSGDVCPPLQICLYDYNKLQAGALIGTTEISGGQLLELDSDAYKFSINLLWKRAQKSGHVDIQLKVLAGRNVVTMMLNSNLSIPVFKEPITTSEKTGVFIKKGNHVKFLVDRDNQKFYELADNTGYVYKNYKDISWVAMFESE